MNDTVNGRVLGKDLVQGLVIGDVDLVEVGATARDQLNAVKSDLGRVVKVIDDNDIVTVFEKSEGSEATNVASATAKGG